MDIALLLGRSGRYSQEYEFCFMGKSRERAARLATDLMKKQIASKWEEGSESDPLPNNPFPPRFVQEIERAEKAFLSFDTKEWDGKGVTGVISMIRKAVAPLSLVEAEDEDLDCKLLGGSYVLLGEPEEFKEMSPGEMPLKFWEERNKARVLENNRGTRGLVEFCLGVMLEKIRRDLIGMKREAAERGIVSPMG